MSRERYTTTIDKELLKSAKKKAIEEELEGANAIIEKALKMYLSNKGSLWLKCDSNEFVDLKLFIDNKETFIIGEIREDKDKKEFKELEKKGYKKIGDIIA